MSEPCNRLLADGSNRLETMGPSSLQELSDRPLVLAAPTLTRNTRPASRPRPPAPVARAATDRAANERAAAANAPSLPGTVTSPVTPSLTKRPYSPTSCVTTGTPAANRSSRRIGDLARLSGVSETGSKATSVAANKPARLAEGTHPTIKMLCETPVVFAASNKRLASAPGPGPATTRRACGSCSSTRSQTLNNCSGVCSMKRV